MSFSPADVSRLLLGPDGLLMLWIVNRAADSEAYRKMIDEWLERRTWTWDDVVRHTEAVFQEVVR
jgi:hypothetical protein